MFRNLEEEQRENLKKIIISALLLLALEICIHTGVFRGNRWIPLLLAVIPYLIVGWDVLKEAWENITEGHPFEEEFLMAVATIGAFAIGEYPEAIAVMLLFQTGELFEDYASDRSRDSIRDLMSIAPEYANVQKNGALAKADPSSVEVGDIIVVKPGEKIPLDGVVEEGESLVDTAALTGEPVPRTARKGEEVISGCVNGEGTLKVRVTKTYQNSTVSRILELVEHATDKKTRTEHFVTRFSRVYTPIVTFSAIALAVVPPLALGGGKAVWFDWITRACIFLVVSCPCALVISVPLGFFGGLGAASRIGVLVKGSNYLEALADVKTMVFDKTGTLTKGEFKVAGVYPEAGYTKEKLLGLAAYAENESNHPIAQSIRASYGRPVDGSRVSGTKEISGHGVSTNIDGKKILCGNAALMQRSGVSFRENEESGTVVYLAEEGKFAGSILISDTVREGVKEAIESMKSNGVRTTVMLTGDRKETAECVAKEVGIDEVHAQLLPADKVAEVEGLLKKEQGTDRLAFVGDGINDAPVLMRSDVGIAMGSMGSDAAIEAADIVLMEDNIGKISETVKIARKTRSIVRTNITFAIAVKLIILALGAFGIANMWMASFGDVGVLILCVLNSMRTLRMTKQQAGA